jgi:tRNA 2-selenouridine synthase
MNKITFEKSLNLNSKIYIDCRSPGEFETDHIPEAFNIPILDNSERAIIGKIYKEEGSIEAKKKGVELISPKLKNLINRLLEVTESFENIIFYCARGGLRSTALANFFSLVSEKNIFILEKGYKGYRNFILNFFEQFDFKGFFLVVDGYTGSGKTLILNKLKEKGFPVIDLENLAKHRGSVFGGVGIDGKISQKRFETLLWFEVNKLADKKIIILEGESKNIGKISLPVNFYNRMCKSPHIWIETDLDFRARIIKDDYLANFKSEEELIEPTLYLKRFLGKKNVEMLVKEIKNKNYEFVISFLLKNYYDILYKKHRLPEEKFYKKIYFKTITECVEKVERIYIELIGK